MIHDLRLEIRKDALEILVADIHMDEARAGWHVLTAPAAMRPQTIDDDNFVPAGNQQIADMRSDEPGSAGNYNAHVRSFVRTFHTACAA
jgi:hypothetical protein